MKTIKKMNKYLQNGEMFLMVVLFLGIIVSMSMQVVMRYIFGNPLVWGDEFARYTFVWVVYFGCAYCIGTDCHAKIPFLYERLSPKGQKIATLIGNLVAIAVFAYVGKIAWQYTMKNAHFLTSVTRVSMAWVYAALPIGMALSILQMIFRTVLIFDKEERRR